MMKKLVNYPKVSLAQLGKARLICPKSFQSHQFSVLCEPCEFASQPRY